MTLENILDLHTDFLIRRLHGSGRTGLVVAASADVENVGTHFPKLKWVLAPRISAALDLSDVLCLKSDCGRDKGGRMQFIA
jgi:hypothetical protein